MSNAKAIAGIAMPVVAAVSNSIDVLINAEGLASFVPKAPPGFMEASSQQFFMKKCLHGYYTMSSDIKFVSNVGIQSFPQTVA